MSAGMGKLDPLPEAPAVVRWRERFAADPAQALGAVLSGKVSLGPYDRAGRAEALAQILAEGDLQQADAGLQAWLQSLLGAKTPPDLGGKRFADALVEAFRLMVLLHLRQARGWCAQNVVPLRAWLRGFCLGNSRDPVAALLVALAQGQPDRSLLAFWHGIVRHGQPLPHVRHALTGLHLMPADDQGTPERRVPKVLLRGLLDFGDAQARRGEAKGAAWLMEIDYLAAVYPLSKEAWGRQFREVVQAREPGAVVRRWLDQRYPLALKPMDNNARGRVLHAPFFKEIEPVLNKFVGGDNDARPLLQKFFDENRHYCRESGDSDFLVKAFCNGGARLLAADPAWARDLAHEAALWAPSDPHCWSLLARALEAEGDWRRAEAVYWQARRRFPEDVHSHTQLAHALALHGAGELAVAVARAATGFFPANPVCRSDLAHMLRSLGRLDEALAEYGRVQQDFPRNAICACGKTGVLIELGRLADAQGALAWAEQVSDGDDGRAMQVLAQLRRDLDFALAGRSITPKKRNMLPEIGGGDFSSLSDIAGTNLAHAPSLGQATLWRRTGGDALATAESLIARLPDGPEKLAELGLWHAASAGWSAAAAWFDQVWQAYEGDGVLRVHRQRARARARPDVAVDWAAERLRFPELASVILTEERGHPPHATLPEHIDPSQEQQQDAWFADLIAANDVGLRDRAEEEYLAARHVA